MAVPAVLDAVLSIIAVDSGAVVEEVTRGVIAHARETVLGGRALTEVFARRLIGHRA